MKTGVNPKRHEIEEMGECAQVRGTEKPREADGGHTRGTEDDRWDQNARWDGRALTKASAATEPSFQLRDRASRRRR